jgi:hypothetical protein
MQKKIMVRFLFWPSIGKMASGLTRKITSLEDDIATLHNNKFLTNLIIGGKPRSPREERPQLDLNKSVKQPTRSEAASSNNDMM